MKIKILYIILFLICICLSISRKLMGQKINPKLEKTRKLMKEYNDDLFYKCPNIDKSK